MWLGSFLDAFSPLQKVCIYTISSEDVNPLYDGRCNSVPEELRDGYKVSSTRVYEWSVDVLVFKSAGSRRKDS